MPTIPVQLPNFRDLPSGSDAYTNRLEHFSRLSSADKQAIRVLAAGRVQRTAARNDLVSEGHRPTDTKLILSGWACRYKALGDGRRLIVALLLPGDLCELDTSAFHRMDHSVGAITDVTFVDLPVGELPAVLAEYPRLARAMAWDRYVTLAIQREWTLSVGQLSASERILHLLCELMLRLRAAGLATEATFAFPLTQPQIGEATGLSAVHVNRTVQGLRAQGLMVLQGQRLTIPDLVALQAAAKFDPGYLHLDREGREYDAQD